MLNVVGTQQKCLDSAHRPLMRPLYLHLQAANSKRTDLAKQAAALSQRLVESEIRVRVAGLTFVGLHCLGQAGHLRRYLSL